MGSRSAKSDEALSLPLPGLWRALYGDAVQGVCSQRDGADPEAEK